MVSRKSEMQVDDEIVDRMEQIAQCYISFAVNHHCRYKVLPSYCEVADKVCYDSLVSTDRCIRKIYKSMYAEKARHGKPMRLY